MAICNDWEEQLIARESLAISAIVLGELAKLIQLGRIALEMSSPAFLAALEQLTIIPITLGLRVSAHNWISAPTRRTN